MRRLTLIDSVASNRLGDQIAQNFFSVVSDVDTAMRVEDLPFPPEVVEAEENLWLDFEIGSKTHLRAVPIFHKETDPKNWRKCHRIRFECIIAHGEVMI